jgi:DNA-binding beta-propeller fold protein YncE
MKAPSTQITVAILGMLAMHSSPSAAQIAPNTATLSLCTTIVGPAFIIPDESRSTIAVHAGEVRGVSILSLKTGRPQGQRIPILQRLLAALVLRTTGTLIVGLSDDAGIRVSNFDLANRTLQSTEVFAGIDAESAVFAPNGKYLLGVTRTGAVFKVDLSGKTVQVIQGLSVQARSLAVSPTGTKLYVAGDGLAVVDIEGMRVETTLAPAEHLLEVAVSPDAHTLALRNWHDIELLGLTGPTAGEILASVVVDPTPSGPSISSTRRLAFAPDGSRLFYIRAFNAESELTTLSMNDLRIEAKLVIPPYASAIAIAPERGLVLLTAGLSGQEQLEALDMKTRRVIFTSPLPRDSSAQTNGALRCASSSARG